MSIIHDLLHKLYLGGMAGYKFIFQLFLVLLNEFVRSVFIDNGKWMDYKIVVIVLSKMFKDHYRIENTDTDV